MSEDHVSAPWTDEQVKNLNEYQKFEIGHPFTCTCKHGVSLVATKDGWVCPLGCGYIQNWAWAFMANGGMMKDHLEMMEMMGRIYCTEDNPWDGRTDKRIIHIDAKEISDSGEIVRCECPHCGHSWKVELPE